MLSRVALLEMSLQIHKMTLGLAQVGLQATVCKMCISTFHCLGAYTFEWSECKQWVVCRDATSTCIGTELTGISHIWVELRACCWGRHQYSVTVYFFIMRSVGYKFREVEGEKLTTKLCFFFCYFWNYGTKTLSLEIILWHRSKNSHN